MLLELEKGYNIPYKRLLHLLGENRRVKEMKVQLKKGNKKPLSSKDIIKNQKQLTKIAEAQFRDYYEIPVGEAFSDYGFTFENDEFSLPEAIGFSNNGMILYYNSYEIAPYANGPTDLTIPFSKLEGL